MLPPDGAEQMPVPGDCILVVDDDDVLRSQLRRLVERTGAQCLEASSGSDGLRELYRTSPDLVILDVTMPELSGWATLERIRDLTDIPVLMLTGRGAELEKVRGLRMGADDYLTKPFGQPELLARIDALMRRPRAEPREPRLYGDGLVDIDFAAAEARVNGKPLNLTPLEFRLLGVLIRHPRQVLSTDQLLALAWGDAALPRERVKMYVRYLREKFRDQGVDPPIETLRGFGYRYVPPRAGAAGGDVQAGSEPG
jgi:DNA-binding response OmpR family regulator